MCKLYIYISKTKVRVYKKYECTYRHVPNSLQPRWSNQSHLASASALAFSSSRSLESCSEATFATTGRRRSPVWDFGPETEEQERYAIVLNSETSKEKWRLGLRWLLSVGDADSNKTPNPLPRLHSKPCARALSESAGLEEPPKVSQPMPHDCSSDCCIVSDY